jgi:hypothetical protein
MQRRRAPIWPLLVGLPVAGVAMMIGASLALIALGSTDADGHVEGGWLWVVVAVYCAGGLALLVTLALGAFALVRWLVERRRRAT